MPVDSSKKRSRTDDETDDLEHANVHSNDTSLERPRKEIKTEESCDNEQTSDKLHNGFDQQTKSPQDASEEKPNSPDRINRDAMSAASTDESVTEEKKRDKSFSIRFKQQVGSLGRGIGQFRNPYFVTCDRSTGKIFVSDCDNHRIQVYDATSVSTDGGGGGTSIQSLRMKGSNQGQIRFPHGVIVNSKGVLIVGDGDNHCIQMFLAKDFTFIKSFGSNGCDNGQFEGPSGVAVDSHDNIYVVDSCNHRIQVFDCEGNFKRAIGAGEEGRGWRKGSSEIGKFNTPCDVAVTSDDVIIVSDEHNCRLQAFDQEGQYLFSITHKDDEGNDFQPECMTLTSSGLLLVCDARNNKILAFDAKERRFLSSWDLHDAKWPSGICVTFDNHLQIGRAHV